jgi:putative CocE/NonD family hydrolase
MPASSGEAARHRGAGTEDRLWVDGPRPATIDDTLYKIAERQVGIPMRDGITLAAIVIEPVMPDDGQLPPSLVVTNGYSGVDVMFLPYLRELATRGYAVVLARLRGVPPSEGKAGFYENFGPDGHDVIEWTAKQPFTNGKVGMVGASLLGISQWLAAKEQPEHLVVVAPDDSPSDTYRYLWYVGGMEPGPGRKRRDEVPGVESEYSLAMSNPWVNEFWRERSAVREDIERLARSGLPALMSTGWDSYMVDSASRPYTWMRAAGAGSRAKLVIGPWRHSAMFSGTTLGGEPAPGEMILPYRGFDVQLMWLDRWLRGIDNGIDAEPPVLIYVQGPDEWRHEQDWPLPDEKRMKLFLTAAPSGTVSSLYDGSLAWHLGQPAAHPYSYDPETSRNPVDVSSPNIVLVADGEPRLGPDDLPPGATRAYGRLIMDKSSYESQALTWTSALIDEPTEITGYPKLVIWAAVSRPEASFVAELTDVAPAPNRESHWTSTQITRGYLRADAQFSRTGPTALHPDDVYRFEIELQPTSYVVGAGHRVRVTLQGAAIDPSLDLNWQGPGLNREPFSFTIHTGSDRASFVEIPVIGNEPRPVV